MIEARGPRTSGFLRAFFLQAILLLLTAAAVDVVGFFALSDDFAAALPGYRSPASVPAIFGRNYPKDYFVAKADRGFDIKPTAQMSTNQWHQVENISYRIWSNELGCFDRPHPDLHSPFMYFAGDSYTWGYAPYETKFGTVFEHLREIEVLKCGVTHTGQRHQMAKFLEIAHKIGRWPEKVVIFYCANDVANDYAHPHTTVIDGRQVDNTRLDAANNVVRLDAGWFDQMRAKTANARRALDHPWTAPSRLLLRYSISAQVVNATLHAVNGKIQGLGVQLPVLGDAPVDWFDRYEVYHGRRLFDIHRLAYLQSHNGIYQYANYKYADANRQVLEQWSRHAEASGYKLEVVLLPPGEALLPAGEPGSGKFYSEIKPFLTSLGIKFYDLTAELQKREIGWEDIYWPSDPHFSSDGNIIVGRILAEIL
jgi:hypothetical protein